jgi:hypothetical protein
MKAADDDDEAGTVVHRMGVRCGLLLDGDASVSDDGLMAHVLFLRIDCFV